MSSGTDALKAFIRLLADLPGPNHLVEPTQAIVPFSERLFADAPDVLRNWTALRCPCRGWRASTSASPGTPPPARYVRMTVLRSPSAKRKRPSASSDATISGSRFFHGPRPVNDSAS